MRVLIVGAGGLGTVIAGYLAGSGVDVTLFVKPEQERRLDRPEVCLEGATTLVVPVRVCSNSADLGAVDLALICVKARDTEAALATLGDIQTSTIASLQNGVLKDELLVRRFGSARVIGALTYVAGALRRTGHAHVSNPAATYFGELDGSDSMRVQTIVSAFNSAGLPAEGRSNIVGLEWYKLAIFLRTALVSAITRSDIATVAEHPSLCWVCGSIAREVALVAAAEGHPLPRETAGQFSLAAAGGDGQGPNALDAAPGAFADALAELGRLLRQTDRSFYPSLAQDVMERRPTELEATAGDVLDRAARRGLTLPALETCANLVRGLEAPLRV